MEFIASSSYRVPQDRPSSLLKGEPNLLPGLQPSKMGRDKCLQGYVSVCWGQRNLWLALFALFSWIFVFGTRLYAPLRIPPAGLGALMKFFPAALNNPVSGRAAGVTLTAAAVPVLPTSQTLVGNGGFNVIRNLYFLNGNFFLVGDAAGFNLRVIATERDCDDQLRNVSLSEARALFSNRSTIRFVEASFLLFEGRGEGCKKPSYMAHYYHFMEYLQGVYLLYTAYGVSPAPVLLILFPDTSTTDFVGKSPQHINQLLLRSLFPSALQAGPPFLDSFPNQLLHFELVVTADRAAAHTTKAVGKVNKMVADILPLITKSGSMGNIRASLATAFGAKAAISKKSTVCYINRSNPSRRRLDVDSQERFLDALARVPRLRVKDLVMEDYTFPEQFKTIYNCNVLISVHGNGLTHGLWLPTNGVVIEIFNAGSHTLDYEYIAEARGIRYFAYDTASGLLSYDERHTNTPRGIISPKEPIKMANVDALVDMVTENVLKS